MLNRLLDVTPARLLFLLGTLLGCGQHSGTLHPLPRSQGLVTSEPLQWLRSDQVGIWLPPNVQREPERRGMTSFTGQCAGTPFRIEVVEHYERSEWPLHEWTQGHLPRPTRGGDTQSARSLTPMQASRRVNTTASGHTIATLQPRNGTVRIGGDALLRTALFALHDGSMFEVQFRLASPPPGDLSPCIELADTVISSITPGAPATTRPARHQLLVGYDVALPQGWRLAERDESGRASLAGNPAFRYLLLGPSRDGRSHYVELIFVAADDASHERPELTEVGDYGSLFRTPGRRQLDESRARGFSAGRYSVRVEITTWETDTSLALEEPILKGITRRAGAVQADIPHPEGQNDAQPSSIECSTWRECARAAARASDPDRQYLLAEKACSMDTEACVHVVATAGIDAWRHDFWASRLLERACQGGDKRGCQLRTAYDAALEAFRTRPSHRRGVTPYDRRPVGIPHAVVLVAACELGISGACNNVNDAQLSPRDAARLRVARCRAQMGPCDLTSR